MSVADISPWGLWPNGHLLLPMHFVGCSLPDRWHSNALTCSLRASQIWPEPAFPVATLCSPWSCLLVAPGGLSEISSQLWHCRRPRCSCVLKPVGSRLVVTGLGETLPNPFVSGHLHSATVLEVSPGRSAGVGRLSRDSYVQVAPLGEGRQARGRCPGGGDSQMTLKGQH